MIDFDKIQQMVPLDIDLKTSYFETFNKFSDSLFAKSKENLSSQIISKLNLQKFNFYLNDNIEVPILNKVSKRIRGMRNEI